MLHLGFFVILATTLAACAQVDRREVVPVLAELEPVPPRLAGAHTLLREGDPAAALAACENLLETHASQAQSALAEVDPHGPESVAHAREALRATIDETNPAFVLADFRIVPSDASRRLCGEAARLDANPQRSLMHYGAIETRERSEHDWHRLAWIYLDLGQTALALDAIERANLAPEIRERTDRYFERVRKQSR